MFHWEKLSPDEFKTFQEYITESSRNLLDVVDEYISSSKDKQNAESLDFQCFKTFMAIYLGIGCMSEELCKRVFISFLKKPCKITYKPQGHSHLSKSDSNSLVPVDKCKKSFPVSSISEPIEIKAMLHFVEKQKNLLASAGSNASSLSNNNCLNKVGSSDSNNTLITCSSGRRNNDLKTGRIQLKDLICCLSLLEAGRPEDKLEFMFRLYDTDGNGVLDSEEIECIITHMMTVAKYSGWDVSELKPNLQEMMKEVDLNNDGCVTLEEWMKAGCHNIPLIVLLGVDSMVTGEGCHSWELKHFNRPAYCNHCLSLLVGLGKQGLRCICCRYTVHERCVKECKQPCIETYNKTKTLQPMLHHWVDGNSIGKCDVCSRYIKAYNKLTGRRCRWCQLSVHNKCAQQVAVECSMGPHKQHILSPMQISPSLLSKKTRSKKMVAPKTSTPTLHTPSSPSASTPLSSSLPTTNIMENSVTLQKADEPPDTPDSQSQKGGQSPLVNTPLNHRPDFASTSHTSNDDLNQACPHSCNAFQLTALDDVVPLLVFINPKSGGKQGRSLLKKFQRILNPRQVFNVVNDGGFMNGLNFFKDLPEYRVLVCGGDGTIGWLLESMDKMNYKDDKRPSVAILPLGTGNDLARSLRWGGGYEGEDLNKVLEKIGKSSVVMLDRWHVDIKNSPVSPTPPNFTPLNKSVKNTDLTCSDLALTYFSKTTSQHKSLAKDTQSDVHNSSPNMLCFTSSLPETNTADTATSSTATTKPPCNIINNYFSIGVDASIAHKFHVMREKHPERFNSRMKNKLWYLEYGTSETLSATCKHLHENVNIFCDDMQLDLKHGRSMEGVAILNIASIYGGSNLWGDPVKEKKKKRGGDSDKELSSGSSTSVDLSITTQDMGDGLVEMVGLMNTMHMAKVKGGIHSGVRLAQASNITIQTFKEFPMQIDGEPWIQPPCILTIAHQNQVPMLMAPHSDRKSLFHNWFSSK